MSLLRMNLIASVVFGAVLASAAHAANRSASTLAAQRPSAAANEAAARALSPAQIHAIRAVSRTVLAAKKSGAEDSTDAAQLASLRVTLDQLIAADLDLKNRAPITVQGHESDEQRKNEEQIARRREAVRSAARAQAAQLRSRSGVKAAHGRTSIKDATHSAGMPIGEQRARLFERWAQKLDTALADNNADRTRQLYELRSQLRATKGSLAAAPITHGTPTLQAMPAGYVPPKRNDKNTDAAKK